jgi:hypothetical protein
MIVGGLQGGDITLAHRAGILQIRASHENRSPPSLITRRSAMSRAWRPLPFGKG